MENPPASPRLTEGLDCADRIVRAVLFQLSYPPVSWSVGGDPDTVNWSPHLQGRRPYVLYSSATRGACAVAAARSASAPARSPILRLARPRPQRECALPGS